jgi:SAM-dependent methyltransferase
MNRSKNVFAMTHFYQEDLAYVHHVGFSDFAERAGAEFLQLLRHEGVRSGLVIDLGCGSGIWSANLVRNGYDVFGVDISPSMIKLAHQNAPQAEFQVASLYDVSLRPSFAITVLGEGLNYGAGEANSSIQLESLFRRVGKCLGAGGIFAFDVIVEGNESPMQYRTWHKGPDWAVLAEVSERQESKRIFREISVFRQIGRNYRRSDERYEISVFCEMQIVGLLADAGFAVSVSPGYGDYQLPPRRKAFIGRKKHETI